jgi:hypothetical protein
MRATLRQFLNAHPEMVDNVKRLNSIETEASHDEPFLPIFLRRRPFHPITAECLELLAVSFDQKYVQETSEDVSSLDEALQQAKELVKIMVRSKTAMGELKQPGLAENFHVWSTTIRESFSCKLNPHHIWCPLLIRPHKLHQRFEWRLSCYTKCSAWTLKSSILRQRQTMTSISKSQSSWME